MLETDKSVRRITLELEDFELLQYTGRISEEELITFEAKYHLKCPISLKNRYRSLCTQKVQCSSDRVTMKKWTSQSHLSSWLSTLKDVWKTELICLNFLSCRRCTSKGLKILELKRPQIKPGRRILCWNITMGEQTDGRNTRLVFNEAISTLQKTLKF